MSMTFEEFRYFFSKRLGELGLGSMSSDSSLAHSNALAGGENPLADV